MSNLRIRERNQRTVQSCIIMHDLYILAFYLYDNHLYIHGIKLRYQKTVECCITMHNLHILYYFVYILIRKIFMLYIYATARPRMQQNLSKYFYVDIYIYIYIDRYRCIYIDRYRCICIDRYRCIL